MSTCRSSTKEMGLRMWNAGIAAQTLRNAALVSFPPNPPPRRLVLHTTLLHGIFSADDMSFWCFCGACVDEMVMRSSLSPHHTRLTIGSR